MANRTSLTEPEFSAFTGISIWSLRQMRRKGILPENTYGTLDDGVIVYYLKEFHQWVLS